MVSIDGILIDGGTHEGVNLSAVQVSVDTLSAVASAVCQVSITLLESEEEVKTMGIVIAFVVIVGGYLLGQAICYGLMTIGDWWDSLKHSPKSS